MKEGERIVGPMRRSDSTIRKPICICTGYTPRTKSPIYIPRGFLEMQSSPEVPPGYFGFFTTVVPEGFLEIWRQWQSTAFVPYPKPRLRTQFFYLLFGAWHMSEKENNSTPSRSAS